MIARIWIGQTPVEKFDSYLEYVLRTGIKDYRATPGNRGSWVLRRKLGERAEFLVISFWDSMECIKGFAGEDVDKARYYPEDDDYLLDKAATVSHFEIAGPGPAW